MWTVLTATPRNTSTAAATTHGTVHYAVRRDGVDGIEFVATSTHLQHLHRMMP